MTHSFLLSALSPSRNSFGVMDAGAPFSTGLTLGQSKTGGGGRGHSVGGRGGVLISCIAIVVSIQMALNTGTEHVGFSPIRRRRRAHQARSAARFSASRMTGGLNPTENLQCEVDLCTLCALSCTSDDIFEFYFFFPGVRWAGGYPRGGGG